MTSTERPATLMVMALQPTKRGAWCRTDLTLTLTLTAPTQPNPNPNPNT